MCTVRSFFFFQLKPPFKVYVILGFDLSAMADDLYEEAIIDVVGPDTVLSAPYVIKVEVVFVQFTLHTSDIVQDLLLGDITSRQLDFQTKFALKATVERRTKINSFVLYFDTFFTVTGHPISPSTQVKTIQDGEVILAEVWPVGGKSAPQRRQSLGREKERVTSFSTGPCSAPTHWKQTLFMLREPITVSEGWYSSCRDDG